MAPEVLEGSGGLHAAGIAGTGAVGRAMSRDYSGTLEIDNPSVQCGHCRFGARLTGVWSVEDGRLVFRADADPQPRRGPDLSSCCESSPVVERSEEHRLNSSHLG